MLNPANLLKSAAVAGVLTLGGLAASVAPASADYVTTRCNGYGDCYRVRCDNDGDDCVRTGYYRSDYYHRDRRWVCDADGDDCHWAYYGDRYYRDDYGPHIGFGFHF